MPRGKFVNHKGRNRHFTNPEELEEQRRQDEERRQWRKNKGQDTDSDEDEEDSKAAGGDKSKKSSDSESESESDSDSETEGKAKGVEHLIPVENPNRVQKKAKKLSQLNESLAQASPKPELSRREREQLEKQKAIANYQKLHAAGKTDEARADLARLAIIKQQREEAAKRRDDEKKQKEMALKQKTEQTQKALGKRA